MAGHLPDENYKGISGEIMFLTVCSCLTLHDLIECISPMPSHEGNGRHLQSVIEEDLVFVAFIMDMKVKNFNCIFFLLKQEEMSSLFESLSGGDGNSCRDEAKEKLNIQRLVMDPKRLVELLQICTAIAQGQ